MKDHRDVASRGGRVGGATRTKNAQEWHAEARIHIPTIEKENPGLSPGKLAKLVIHRCKKTVGEDAMTKFIRDERKKQSGSN